MKVLVTGATGFVGSAVVRALKRHGHDVLALVRNSTKASNIARQGVQAAVGDMRQPNSYEPLVRQVDAVIHAAQSPLRGRWSPAAIAEMQQADATMTRTLAWACLAQDKPLVYSSGGLTHCCDGDAWINECSPANPCLIAAGHASLAEWLEKMHDRRGLRSVVISPGLIYGPGGFLQRTVEMLLCRRYCHPGNPGNFWSLVHLDDVGEAYVLGLERGQPGETYFISDDQPLRREEAVDCISNSLGLCRVARMPGWLAKIALGSPMVEAIASPVRLRNKKARRELGWQPRFGCFQSALPGLLQEILGRMPAIRSTIAPLHLA
ncbi:MAG: NAD-dependent epimerase/dehydratase family protein [Pirellulales bacterium]